MDKKDTPFNIDLSDLKPKPKAMDEAAGTMVDKVAENLGFVSRQPHGRGRPRSPRVGQVHARVLPAVADAIAAESRRRGVQQGVLLEEAWALYCTHNNLPQD